MRVLPSPSSIPLSESHPYPRLPLLISPSPFLPLPLSLLPSSYIYDSIRILCPPRKPQHFEVVKYSRLTYTLAHALKPLREFRCLFMRTRSATAAQRWLS